jgi:hypothetical protein
LISLLAIALVVAQTPLPGLTADWVATPLQASEFGHFVRHVPSQPDEAIVGTIRVCDCQPGPLFDMLASALQAIPTAVVTRDPAPVQVCGRAAQHLVVTGVADGTSRKNLDIYAFRTTDALAVIEYAFTKPAPAPQDEAAMKAVCPQNAPIAS